MSGLSLAPESPFGISMFVSIMLMIAALHGSAQQGIASHVDIRSTGKLQPSVLGIDVTDILEEKGRIC